MTNEFVKTPNRDGGKNLQLYNVNWREIKKTNTSSPFHWKPFTSSPFLMNEKISDPLKFACYQRHYSKSANFQPRINIKIIVWPGKSRHWEKVTHRTGNEATCESSLLRETRRRELLKVCLITRLVYSITFNFTEPGKLSNDAR